MEIFGRCTASELVNCKVATRFQMISCTGHGSACFEGKVVPVLVFEGKPLKERRGHGSAACPFLEGRPLLWFLKGSQKENHSPHSPGVP